MSYGLALRAFLGGAAASGDRVREAVRPAGLVRPSRVHGPGERSRLQLLFKLAGTETAVLHARLLETLAYRSAVITLKVI